jgi:hypothetical protein
MSDEKAYKIWWKKLKTEISWENRCRWKDNVKIDLREIVLNLHRVGFNGGLL